MTNHSDEKSRILKAAILELLRTAKGRTQAARRSN